MSRANIAHARQVLMGFAGRVENQSPNPYLLTMVTMARFRIIAHPYILPMLPMLRFRIAVTFPLLMLYLHSPKFQVCLS